MTTGKKRLVLGGATAVLVAAVLVAQLGRGTDVSLATAIRDTLTVTIPVEGRTRARERFTLAAPISGRVTRLDVRAGDRVSEGQLLARLYPAPEDPRVVAGARADVGTAEARLAEAVAHLREAETQAAQAQREAERRRPLLDLGAITRENLEQAELAVVVAEERLGSATAGVAAAGAALEGARARLLGAAVTDPSASPIDLVAPVAGRVELVPDESERVVTAGTPLVVLADLGGLEVVLEVLSEDAVRVETGSHVVFSGWGGDGPLHGVVRTVTLVGYTKVSALGVEEQRVDVIADLREPPPTLGTGYRVSGEIVVWKGDDVLQVPTSALFRTGEAWQLFAVEEGRARRRDVRVGRSNERSAEILEGLAAGDVVIVFPPEGIDDGVTVRAR